jgi:hypothetical protein
MDETQQHYPYCPDITDCMFPYRCTDGFCRIPCKADKDCPNKWRCSDNGACLDGEFLRRQQAAATHFALHGGLKVFAAVPQPRTSTTPKWFVSSFIIIGFVLFVAGWVWEYRKNKLSWIHREEGEVKEDCSCCCKEVDEESLEEVKVVEP